MRDYLFLTSQFCAEVFPCPTVSNLELRVLSLMLSIHEYSDMVVPFEGQATKFCMTCCAFLCQRFF